MVELQVVKFYVATKFIIILNDSLHHWRINGLFVAFLGFPLTRSLLALALLATIFRRINTGCPRLLKKFLGEHVLAILQAD